MEWQQLFEQAEFFFRRDRCEQIFPLMEQAIADDPTDAKPYVMLAKANLLVGQAQEGIDALEAALRLDDRLSEIHILYGHMLWMTENQHGADQHFERGLADASNAGVHYWYARFLLTELVDLLGVEPVAKHARRAYELDPRSVDHIVLMAIVGEMRGDYTGAEQYYRRALWQDPQDPAVLDNYGTFLYRQGDYQQSVRLLQRAGRQAPEDQSIQKHLQRTINRVSPAWALSGPLIKGLAWTGCAGATLAALLPHSGTSRWSSPWLGLLLLFLFMVEPLVNWLWAGLWLQGGEIQGK